MFHNVNGIAPRGCEGIDMFANNQVTLEVDLQGIVEHCFDTTKYMVYQNLQTTIRTHVLQPSLLALHSSEESSINQYKPGGTGALLLGTIVSRLETNGIHGDPMGRWSAVHLRRHDKPPVTVITAYQVCPRPTNILGNTAYHQQVRALNKKGRSPLTPRQAFIHDLQTYISTLQAQGNEIILGGDFNESLTDRNSGIHRLVTSRNLVDPFLTRFPNLPSFGTHINGRRRIDLLFVSPNILTAITKVGYAPYDFSTTSDHRACLVELDSTQLFGHQHHSSNSCHRDRLLHTRDKVSVEKFITEWFRLLSEHGVFTQQSSIEDDTVEPQVVEYLDSLIGRCGRQAEKICQRRRPEFYSKAIVQQRVKVSILRGHLRALRMGIDRTGPLTTKMTRFGIEIPLSPSIRITHEMLTQAIETLRETSKEHANKRNQELEEKISSATANGHKTRAQILSAIRKTEIHRNTYRILRNMRRRGTTTAGLDRVEIPSSWPPPGTPLETICELEDPKGCQHWKRVTNPTEVEYYLMLRNRLHFGQAEGTPFTRTPFVEDLDWGATTEAAEAILQGTYPTIHPTPNCEDLLKACKQIEKSDNLPARLTFDEFRQKITKWREATTTSPSGRHLGWYKSLFVNGRPTAEPDDPTSTTFRDMQETIGRTILSIINYCLRRTYVLNRWRKIVNVMIFKEQGNFQIHRLRIIHIYEADFNLLLAVKWRQLLRTADRRDLLNSGQYGGRPGCEAQSLTLLEELKYDLAYLTRRTLFNFDNDATSCYDRIVVPFASLINRKYGLHKQVVALHAKTLHSAEYYLKTAQGISDTHYSTSQEYPIHGTGQGSGNSPCIWLLISSTLFDVHQSLSYGATFISPDGQFHTTMSMVGFVDDSTGTVNNFQPQQEDPLPLLFQRMQHDAQLWNNLLYSTGGRLELPKCSFHILRFDFRPNGTPVPSISTYDNYIHITDLEHATPIPIPSKRIFQPHKTLGHHKSPSAKQTTALNALRSKADHIALLISTSPLSRQGAILAYHTVYNPSIRYVLPQSFFSEKDLQTAQAPSLYRIIPKCGYNRHIARSLLFAPKSVGGAGFLPWYLLQGEGRILHFLKHWRTSTIVSDTLRVAITWAQWQSGHSKPLLEDVHVKIPFLECRWIQSLRSFLSRINGAISIDIAVVPSKERVGDFYIMDFALQCGLFSTQELAILNYCRLYLHITTVSELFDSTGQHILPMMYDCQREPWFNPDTVVTLQTRPSEYQVRRLWHRLCRQWTTSDGTIGLSYRLGPWTRYGNHLRRRRQTYRLPHDPTTIYHWHNTCYRRYTQDSGNPAKFWRHAESTLWFPTSRCIPVDATSSHKDFLYLKSSPSCRIKSSIPSVCTNPSLTAFIRTQAKWIRLLIEGCTLRLLPYEIITRINQLGTSHTILAVSDGSVKGSHLTYGWIFGLTDGTVFAHHHSGSGDGPPTSHRAEAWGMLSMITFIHQLYLFTGEINNLHSTPIAFTSDNSGLVTRVRARMEYATSYPNSTLLPDWDIVEQIYDILIKIPHDQKNINWVKGHQDDKLKELPPEAQFNVWADRLATSAHLQKIPQQQISIKLPSARCYFTISNTPISGNYLAAIRDAYLLPSYKQYVSQRHRWNHSDPESVDWVLLRRSISKSKHHPIQMVKFLHDKLPTAVELSKSIPGTPNTYHYCTSPETFSHLLRCDNSLSSEFRTKILKETTTYLTKKRFPPEIQTGLHLCLSWSLDPGTNDPTNDAIPSLSQQVSLGPNAFLKGFFHCSWQQTLTSLLSRCTNDEVTNVVDLLAGFITILWDTQLEFWHQHTDAIQTAALSSNSTIHYKTAHYQQRIRQLYALKDQCLHVHREHYFPPDLDHYLSTSTPTQLKQYLFYYEPAIRQSLQQAQAQPHRRLTTFPGFVRNTVQVLRRIPALPKLTVRHSSNQSFEVQGAPNHHKHTRWRNPIQSMSLKSFFPSKTPSPT